MSGVWLGLFGSGDTYSLGRSLFLPCDASMIPFVLTVTSYGAVLAGADRGVISDRGELVETGAPSWLGRERSGPGGLRGGVTRGLEIWGENISGIRLGEVVWVC